MPATIPPLCQKFAQILGGKGLDHQWCMYGDALPLQYKTCRLE
jgi:hypothetical protein